MTLLPFPVRRVGRPVPDSVRVGFDFGAWCVELRGRGRLLRRQPAVSEAAARAEAAWMSATGLRLLPDAPMPVAYEGEVD